MVCVNNISLDYNFGFNMSNTEYFTAFARNGNSEVSLAVVNPEEKIVTVNGVTGPVTIPGTVQSESGGIVTLALTVKLGPGERLEQSQQNITVSVIDTYDYKVHDPAIASITFNLKDVTYWYELVNDSVTGKASWVPADIIPGDSVGNRDGSHNRVFCGLAFWDSTTIPSLNYDPLMGHNGNHALQVTAIDGTASKELYFEEYDAITGTWGNDYDMTVKDGTVYIRNLTLTNVHSSTGTEDYFRYSYLYDSPYNEPTINFTIDDIDNPELEPTYLVYISAWPTAATPTLFAESFVLPANSVVVDTIFNSPGAKSVNLADFDVNLEHGTYAYEIEIHKYVDNNLIDWFALKWPYCLTIGEHSLYSKMVTADQEAMCIDFEITDACYGNNNHAPYQGGVNITVDAIDYNLNNRGSKTFNDVEVGDSFEGEVLANIQGYEEDGLWRSIYTGEDKCWQEYRRDHKGSRMLATNYTNESFPWRLYIYKYDGNLGGTGHISFGYSWLYPDDTAYLWTFGAYPDPLDISELVTTIFVLAPGGITWPLNWSFGGDLAYSYKQIMGEEKPINHLPPSPDELPVPAIYLNMSQEEILLTIYTEKATQANDAFSILVSGRDAISKMKLKLKDVLNEYSIKPEHANPFLFTAPELRYENDTYTKEETSFYWPLTSISLPISLSNIYLKDVGYNFYNCVGLATSMGNVALDGAFGTVPSKVYPWQLSDYIIDNHAIMTPHSTYGGKVWYTPRANNIKFTNGDHVGKVLYRDEIITCFCFDCSLKLPRLTYFHVGDEYQQTTEEELCFCDECSLALIKFGWEKATWTAISPLEGYN